MLLSDGDRRWLREKASARAEESSSYTYGGGAARLHWSKAVRALRLRKLKRPKTFEIALESAEKAFPHYSDIKVSIPSRIDWELLPRILDVEGGGLPAERRDRKRIQLENVITHALRLANKNARVVDFCCGLGHQSLPMAFLRPDCKFLLLDKHLPSLQRARRRAHLARLHNVEFRLASVQSFSQDFDLGIALHACGGASDHVLECCLKQNANFVIVPCCLGGISPPAKSHKLRTALLDPSHFTLLAKAADTVSQSALSQSKHHASLHSSLRDPSQPCSKSTTMRTRRRKDLRIARAKCMTLLDLDRLAYAQDFAGYATCLTRMVPPSASPKNHILLGAPIPQAAFIQKLQLEELRRSEAESPFFLPFLHSFGGSDDHD